MSLTPRLDLINGAENVIINSGMDFFQRSVGPLAVPSTEYVSGYFISDRFSGRNEVATGAANGLRSTDVPTALEAGANFNASIEFDITTAKPVLSVNDNARIKYIVEGYDAARFARKGFRLQFWVKSNKTGVYTLALSTSAAGRVYLTTYTIETTSWEQKWVDVPAELTGTWNTTTGEGLNISWTLAAGSGLFTTGFDTWKAGGSGAHSSQANLFDSTANFFRLTGVMLCPGNFSELDEALPYFRASKTIQEEQARCQRYCVAPFANVDTLVGSDNSGLGAGQSFNTNIGRIYHAFPVTMRGVPTMTFSAVGDFCVYTAAGTPSATTALTFNEKGINGVEINLTTVGAFAAGGQAAMLRRNNLAGYMYFESEL